ncbi:MAG: MucB/RseB C-terminal domain-containing protein [Saccharospirillaceae bacterium]|nr:MucB/RseB C-terminal domain-containing protein [Pseudomonadales bacterium]NRB78290.1 MucB/RseB C-terminal domain-containing protein [Saccharospirillaceae bacterium]
MRKLIIGFILNLLVCAYSQANMGTMWFDRMSQAITQRDYQGTYIIRDANELFSYYLQHTNKNNNTIDRIVQLDEDGIEVISTPLAITQYIPHNSKYKSNHIIKASPFSIFNNLSSSQLAKSYTFKLMPKERICGYQAVVVQLISDKWRNRYKIWIDQHSALPLKVTVMDEYNTVIKEFRFVDLDIKQIGENIELPDNYPNKENHSIIKRTKITQSNNNFTAQDIPISPVTWKPDNFTLISSGQIKSSQEDYLNYTYSDGLNTFSILVSDSPVKQQNKNKESSTTIGATNILISNKDQKLISILGEVPIQTLKKIAHSVEFITP